MNTLETQGIPESQWLWPHTIPNVFAQLHNGRELVKTHQEQKKIASKLKLFPV